MCKRIRVTMLVASICLTCGTGGSLGQGGGGQESLFAYIEDTRSVEILHGPGQPKNRITKRDMQQIVRLRPKKLLCVNVVFDSDAKKELASVSSLRELVVPRSNIGDEDIKLLNACKDLEFVNLIDCDVTDDGLVLLSNSFPALKYVHVNGTAVTASAVKRLRAEKPDVVVYWGPVTSERFREKRQ